MPFQFKFKKLEKTDLRFQRLDELFLGLEYFLRFLFVLVEFLLVLGQVEFGETELEKINLNFLKIKFSSKKKMLIIYFILLMKRLKTRRF